VKAWCRAGHANWIIGAGLATLICLTSGYSKDISGGSEQPALPRVSGSKLVASERKEQGEMIIPLERIVFDLQTQKFNNFKTVSASGLLTRTLEELPAQSTPQEAARDYETSLREAKGEILFSGTQDALDNGDDRFVDQVYHGRVPDRIYNLLLLNRENAYLAGKYNWNGRDVYVQVYTFANSEGQSTSLVRKGRVGVLVETVEAGPAHPPTPLVTSEQMADEINRTGRIALYGLYFDTGRTEIKSESKPTLEEIADLLKREPNLKLLVVGHTDNVGTFEANRDLSQRRAESVVNALVSGFGIAPDRLIPFGVSYAAPVASNATSEGRSQNRRVELVRY
jgi:outer membrane protein OmpA-like peptidoglycan-associated protein